MKFSKKKKKQNKRIYRIKSPETHNTHNFKIIKINMKKEDFKNKSGKYRNLIHSKNTYYIRNINCCQQKCKHYE